MATDDVAAIAQGPWSLTSASQLHTIIVAPQNMVPASGWRPEKLKDVLHNVGVPRSPQEIDLLDESLLHALILLPLQHFDGHLIHAMSQALEHLPHATGLSMLGRCSKFAQW